MNINLQVARNIVQNIESNLAIWFVNISTLLTVLTETDSTL